MIPYKAGHTEYSLIFVITGEVKGIFYSCQEPTFLECLTIFQLRGIIRSNQNRKGEA